MKGRKDNTDDRKRQGQHKDTYKYGQTQTRQTKMSVQHQPYSQALKNASIKLAFSNISPWLAYIVVYIYLDKVDLF